jgi:hypothetical protein
MIHGGEIFSQSIEAVCQDVLVATHKRIRFVGKSRIGGSNRTAKKGSSLELKPVTLESAGKTVEVTDEQVKSTPRAAGPRPSGKGTGAEGVNHNFAS